MHYNSEFWRVETPDGQQLPLYCDIEKFGQVMKEISPQDAVLIDEYLKDARKFGKVEFMAVVSGKFRHFLNMIPLLGAIKKWSGVTMAEFSARFKNPTLRSAFQYLHYGWPNVPVMIHMAFLGMCHQQLLGYPLGGSLAFAQNIARRFESLGGTLHYDSMVEKILVENHRAVGIQLANGTRILADVVISNADGYSTIYRMLDGKYTSDRLDDYYEKIPDEQDMNTTISLGVNRSFPSNWRAVSYILPEPVMIAGCPRSSLDVEFYDGEEDFAPSGMSVLKILMKSRYGYWKNLQKEEGAYPSAKQKDIETVIDILDQKYPGLRGQIMMRDMATPMTVERYTGNIQGNQAWSPPDFSVLKMMQGLSRQLPGLANFYMVGQWALGVLGIPNVAMDGRNVIKDICKLEKKRFKTDFV
jgi:phytoene dehydrogenase-like protein